MSAFPKPVQIYRLGGSRPRLALHDGSGLYDLTEFLRQSGRPPELLELAADGWFSPEQLESKLPRSGATDWHAIPTDSADVAAAPLALPIARQSVGKILALGKNFREHAAEFDEEVPTDPLFFNKLPETLVPDGRAVRIPTWYEGRLDHEVELCVVIGLQGKDVPQADAFEHVAFYTLANDLTARSMQGSDRKLSHPWFRAKNMDGFCPLGPCLIPEGYLDPNAIMLTATVGDELRQKASTAQMVVDIPQALSYLSSHLTLIPGDLVLMGTPAGVGPLQDGDLVVCHAEAFGSLRTPIERPKPV